MEKVKLESEDRNCALQSSELDIPGVQHTSRCLKEVMKIEMSAWGNYSIIAFVFNNWTDILMLQATNDVCLGGGDVMEQPLSSQEVTHSLVCALWIIYRFKTINYFGQQPLLSRVAACAPITAQFYYYCY
jgi:hypothetical protein